jgi:hypothetical protein
VVRAGRYDPADLNAHSFFNDTKVNVVTCDAALARDTRPRPWATHCEPLGPLQALLVDG